MAMVCRLRPSARPHSMRSLDLGTMCAEDNNMRTDAWAATMEGHFGDAIRHAHADEKAEIGPFQPLGREAREEIQEMSLAKGATRARGAGNRQRAEEPDPQRTCFERDRDRILHSASFRRLAGKTQVFVFPDDHQRTRLTHALEVAQVALSVARNLRLNETLAEAIAIGHDCGHGPGGHASEDALSPFVPGGFNHATWGANVSLAHLNLCNETLDGIRNHSWSLPSPTTPEGIVVSWADRIAYACHDLEDAVEAGIVTYDMVPEVVRERCGTNRSAQLRTFIASMTEAAAMTNVVGMTEPIAEALAALRRFNYENIYLRPASQHQADLVIDVLRLLVEFYVDRPNLIPNVQAKGGLSAGSDVALHESVAYVAGMTDRYAFQQAIIHLGWEKDRLPAGIDF